MLNDFLIFTYYILTSILQGVAIVMSVYVLMGWIVAIVRPKHNSTFIRIYSFLYNKIDPIFSYCRRFVPPIMGFDFSPILAFLAIEGMHYLLTLLFMMLLKI